ncbi:hypothetical protein EJV47_06785 [Hymenobacter gummosus]|uniref:Uncharacterized protein n=1 Tax=Hymenobacter gummosus TaxID=1776032 RepID=A0A3S0HAQ6_9BACT|nr:hypothetical protein [Hymenobacter gummosus]RTQ51501.1 hypothetical protein EJV47_06785 [Hymenobacter gummosus]
MKISVERLIKEGDISPLRWGMNGDDLARVLPGSFGIIQDYRRQRCPWLDFDGIEFYFDEDFYLGLNQLIIQAWRITRRDWAHHRHFDLAWIRQRLTYRKVLGHLQRLGWAYEVWPSGGAYQSPLLLVQGRAAFLFYYDEVATDDLELCKIVLYNPGQAQWLRQRLADMHPGANR